MSLPYFPVSTGSVVAEIAQQKWTKTTPCPPSLARAHLGALLYAGQLDHWSMRALSRFWHYGKTRTTTLIVAWRDWYQGLQIATRVDLPQWVLKIGAGQPESQSDPIAEDTANDEDQRDTAGDGTMRGQQRDNPSPRARSLPKEVDEERDGDTPPTPQGVEVEPLPFPVFKVDPAEVSADERRAWSSYRRHLGEGDRLTRKRFGSLRARLKEHGVDQIVALGDWLATSQHDRAVYLRQRADPMTALRPDNCVTYLEMMVKGSRAPSGKVSPLDMAAGACDLLDRLFGEREAVKASQPAIEVFSHPVAP